MSITVERLKEKSQVICSTESDDRSKQEIHFLFDFSNTRQYQLLINISYSVGYRKSEEEKYQFKHERMPTWIKQRKYPSRKGSANTVDDRYYDAFQEDLRDAISYLKSKNVSIPAGEEFAILDIFVKIVNNFYNDIYCERKNRKKMNKIEKSCPILKEAYDIINETANSYKGE